MSRPAKSQWDFGELFPQEAVRKILSVSQLTSTIKRALEERVGQVWVSGEITNFRAQGSSGHIYFTLKDASAQISCVLFRGEAIAHRELLADGQKVVLGGDVTVYEARGQYQLRVSAVELQGVGALQAAFEKLKQKLAAEGLFASERKRPVPRFPARLGLVTSPEGAALRDVVHVVERRHPGLQIFLAPCCVQGHNASYEIAAAIRLLNEWSEQQPFGQKLDLILLTRGGGSLEDLWAFNEEPVARAIFQSALPVVSAVGHEIDFTIGDFVADVRAATPSAAAELITEGVFASRHFVSGVLTQLAQRVSARLMQDKRTLHQWNHRLLRVHPVRQLQARSQRLDDLQASLTRSMRQWLRQHRSDFEQLVHRLQRVRPRQILILRQERFQTQVFSLSETFRHQLQRRLEICGRLEEQLRLLSPLQVLARGYSITRDARTGEVVRRADQAQIGQRLKIRLAAGEIESRVESRFLPPKD